MRRPSPSNSTLYGIGAANVEGGWYARLKGALDADISRLTDDRKKGLFDYSDSRMWLLVGDLGFSLLVVAFALTIIVRA